MLQSVDPSEIKAIEVDGDSLNCRIKGNFYGGFIVSTSIAQAVLSNIESLASIPNIRLPTHYTHTSNHTYFLSEGLHIPATTTLSSQGLQRMDCATHTINQLLEITEALSALGFTLSSLSLSDFDLDISGLSLTLVNIGTITNRSKDIEQGFRSLGLMIAHILAGNQWKSINDIKLSRPQCPDRYFHVLDTLLNFPSRADFEEIRQQLRARSTPFQPISTTLTLEEILLSDSLHLCRKQNISVYIESAHDLSLHVVASELARKLPSSVCIDGIDPITKNHLERNSYSTKTLIVANAHYVHSSLIKTIEDSATRAIFIIPASEKLSDNYNQFSHLRSVTIDLRNDSLRNLLKSVSISSRTIVNSTPDDFFSAAVPPSLYTAYVKKHIAADTLPSMLSFHDSLLSDLVPSNSTLMPWLTASRTWAPIDRQFLQTQGLTEEIFTKLDSLGLISTITWNDRLFIRFLGLPKIEPVNLSTYANYMRSNGAPPGQWMVKCASDHLITLTEDELFTLGTTYAHAERFDAVSNIIEEHCRTTRSAHLLNILINNLRQIKKLNYTWHEHVLQADIEEKIKLQHLERLIDHYKSSNSHSTALEVGRHALSILGIHLSKTPSLFWIYLTFAWIFVRVYLFGIKRFLNLNEALDEESSVAATTRIAMKSGVSAFIVSPKSFAEIALRTLLHTRKSYITPHHPGLIMALGMIAGNYAYSLRTAKKVYGYCSSLIDHFNLSEARHQVAFMYLSTIAPYVDEADLDKRLIDAFQAAKSESPEWACYISGAEIPYAVYCGKDNVETLRRIDENIPLINSIKQTTPITLHRIIRRWLKALNTDLRITQPIEIGDDDGTSHFGESCTNLLLTSMQNDVDAVHHYDRMKNYIFGVKGQPILYLAQQSSLHVLYRAGRWWDILLIACEFAFLSTRNKRAFTTKRLHSSAYLAATFGLGFIARHLLDLAARAAEATQRPLDAAIIHLHTSHMVKDLSLSRIHTLHAADLFQTIGYRGLVNHLLSSLETPNRASNSAAGLTDLVQWLERQVQDTYIFPLIEKKLQDILNAERVCCIPATVTPPEDLESLIESAKTAPIFTHNGQLTQCCTTVFVDGSHYATLYIEFQSGVHDQQRLLAISNTVHLGLLAYAQREKLQSALARERRMVASFPIWQHEVGQPLSFLTSIAERGINSHTLNQNEIRAIHDAAIEISRIVDAFSEVTPDSKQVLELTPVSLKDEIRSLIIRVEKGCEAKKLDFSPDITIPSDLWILTDQRILRGILKNLSDNAVKYTDRGEVAISAFVDHVDNDVFFSFTVQDTGVGIAQENLQRIFEPRFREDIDRSTTRKHSSLGVGLSQVKSYTEALGGDVSVSSDGGGSEFRFRCKFTQCHPTHHSQIEATFDGVSALVIDDSFDNLTETERVMKNAGIEVTTTHSPTEGVNLAVRGHILPNGEKRPYDVIFCDIEMPGMDGHDVAEAIKANNITTPIVALTAYPKLKESPRNKLFIAVLRKHLSQKSLSQTLTQKLGISPTSLKFLIPRHTDNEHNINDDSFIGLGQIRNSFSDIEIKHYLLKLSVMLSDAKPRFAQLINEKDSQSIKSLAHTLISPLLTLNSKACDIFDTFQGDDPLDAITSTDYVALINDILEDIAKAIAQLRLPADQDEAKIHSTFKTFLTDEDSRFESWYFQYRDILTQSMDEITIDTLTRAIEGHNAPEALAVYGRVH